MVIRALLILLVAVTSASAAPLPQPKVGQCPAGYYQSGGYCAPMTRNSPDAVAESRAMPERLDAVGQLLHFNTQTLSNGERQVFEEIGHRHSVG